MKAGELAPLLNTFGQQTKTFAELFADHHHRSRQAQWQGLHPRHAHSLSMKSWATWHRVCPSGRFLADFPDLTETDIRACLAFAADGERRFEIVTT